LSKCQQLLSNVGPLSLAAVTTHTMHHAVRRRNALLQLSALGAAAALPSWASAQENRLVLGQSAALSGPAAQLGIQFNRGARLCFDQVNAQGGVNGITIELRKLDDGYEPARCKANTDKLIADGVTALFGYVGTPTTVAAVPAINAAKIPLIAPLTGAMVLREPLNRNIFHVRASYDDETELLVSHMTNLGLKRIAVFRQNDSYGEAGLNGVTKALLSRKLAPVAVGTVERNSTNVAAAVSAILPTKPDAIVQISAYSSCAAFIRAARSAGYGGGFMNVSFVGTKALSDALGPSALGVMVSQVMPDPSATSVPVVRDFLGAVKAAGGDAQANYTSIEGYLAARVVVEALKRMRNPSREALVTSLESLGNVNLGGYPVSFSPRDHAASHFTELTMLTGDGGVRR
jgi:branched-chain amino acid transport system substrate-binding protein